MKIASGLKSRQFLIFSVIGVMNTVINLAVAIILIEGLSSNQVTANSIAFLVANIASYCANSKWNFKTPMTVPRYGRFLLSSLSVVGLVLLLSAIADWYHIHYLWTLGALAILSPVMSFLMVRHFAFRA